jgi:hypothetical protein
MGPTTLEFLAKSIPVLGVTKGVGLLVVAKIHGLAPPATSRVF